MNDKRLVGIILAIVVVVAGALALKSRNAAPTTPVAPPPLLAEEPEAGAMVEEEGQATEEAEGEVMEKKDGEAMENEARGVTAVEPKTYTVTVNDSGFSPAVLTIKKGDTITFTNRSADTSWPASDVHPTHRLCSGFDAKRGLATGESYSYTFTEARACPMHDHLHPQVRGTITITE